MNRPVHVLFMGTPLFGKIVLARLLRTEGVCVVGVVAQPDAPRGRSRQLQREAVAQLAYEVGLPLWQPTSLHEWSDAVPVPDVIVTAAYGKLLPKSVLSLPVLGCINAHASLLPAYRGASPIQHALFDGCTHTGVTIMHMAERMDAGDIICARAVPIGPTDDVHTLTVSLGMLAGDLVAEAVGALLDGTASRTPQDEAHVSYAPKLIRVDERIQFSRHTAIVLTRRLRAFLPSPGMYTTWKGKTLKIYGAQCLDGTVDRLVVPGTVVAMGTSGIDIATADRSIWRATLIQQEGRQKMDAAQFVRGTSMRVGDVLGCGDG